MCSVEALLPAAVLFHCFSSGRFDLDGGPKFFFLSLGLFPALCSSCDIETKLRFLKNAGNCLTG